MLVVLIRDVARNLLRGNKRGGLGDRKSQEVWGFASGRAPVGVWGRSRQKPETNANFQLRTTRVGHAPMDATPPLVYAAGTNSRSRIFIWSDKNESYYAPGNT